MRQGPLAGRYAFAAAMVVLSLVPYLAISAAMQPLAPIIGRQLHMGPQALALSSGMANAAYAVGTVLAIQLAQHLPPRRLMLLYSALLVVGSVLAASATSPGVFIAGHVMQGLCTSLLLIAAAPALFLGFPPARMRSSLMIMSLSLFGALALGPVIGGIQASANAWRPLFGVAAGVALVAFVLSLLTFQDEPPADRSAPIDTPAVALGTAGCVAAFFGASQLATHGFMDAIAFFPLITGMALILILLVNQYRSKRPLLLVRSLVSTIPTAGIVVAICAAAASGSAIALTSAMLEGRYGPRHVGLLYLPEFAGAVISAVLFGLVFRSRMIHYLVLAGVGSLGLGIVVIGGVLPPTQALTLIGSGLIGFGLGASVVPALFLVAFSLRASELPRVFAIVELMRAVAAFMVTPIIAHLAATVGGSATGGTRIALWICFGLASGGAIVGVALYALGRVRPPSPAMERWSGGEPAFESPPLLAAVRGHAGEGSLDERSAPAAHADGRPRHEGLGSHLRATSPIKPDR